LKKFTYLLTAGFLFLGIQVVTGQKTNPTTRITPEEKHKALVAKQNGSHVHGDKCGTMDWLNQVLNTPKAKAIYDANEAKLGQAMMRIAAERRSNPAARVLQQVTIPTVFHIVLTQAQHNALTDQMILDQLRVLNEDFSGLNADSTNVPAEFQAVRGHSGISFCLAKRTPDGLPTTGIVRIVSNTVSNGSATSDPVKNNAAGGSTSWDPTKYLNIWLTNFTAEDALGYATFPIGTAEHASIPAPITHQGVVVLAQSVPGGSASPYNKGRTLTHEVGHFFWLRHITGDANCGNDFPSTASLDDTPQQAQLTGGCPTGAQASGCAASPNPPGKMYQNFMDYTSDACLSMFTIGQGLRMEAALATYRPSFLLANDGCTPPTGLPANDASISAILAPTAAAAIGCPTVTPIVTLKNLGTSTLTSANIIIKQNGTDLSPFAWSGSLASGGSVNVTLPALTLTATGAYELKIRTSLPNGVADGVPTNDESTINFTRIAAQSLPASNDFETVFLNPGFSINNPDNDELEWIWATPGTGGTGTGAAAIDNYNLDGTGTHDDIVTPIFANTGLLATDSIYLSFDLAYKYYTSIFGSASERLQILVTNNCGASYTTIYDGIGDAIANGGTGDLFIPTAADWRKRTFAIGQNIFAAGNFQFVIRVVNNWANVMWIDNINVAMKPRKDLMASAIARPAVTECTSNFAPTFTVRNNGGQTITAFKVGYSLNGGAVVEAAVNQTLVPGATYTHTFPAITFPTGTGSIRYYGIDPLSAEGGVDGTPANNEITRSFVVPAKLTNLTEGFEGATFAPASWLRINADNGITWQRVASGKNSSFSASVNNYNYSTNVYLFDHLQTPIIKTDGADSVIITFDVAHQPYEDAGGRSVDNLGVLASRDCGTSFSLIYSKTGEDLATVLPGTEAQFVPTPNDWRRERVVFNLSTITAAETVFQFRNGNAYGNDIYIDNINIEPKFKRDLKLESVEPPVACGTSYTPTAVVRNNGTHTITGFKVAYSVNNAAAVETTVTGVNFLKNTTMNVALPVATLNAGGNTIKVYSFEPIGADAGTGDQYLVNDTITRTITTTATVQNSIVQTFDATTFPPAGWGIGNTDGALTWARSAAGNNSVGSAYLRNFTYYNNGQRDALFSPVLEYNQADSLTLTFDVSATKIDYADPATTASDTLEVLITKDCGNTYTSVYKKWGNTLQTVGNANTGGQFTEFTPNGSYLWRNEKVNLAPAAGATSGTLQVVFRNTTNNRNNIYLDNVNIVSKTLPERLKADGYIVSPSPFTTQFRIWFIQAPTDLKYVAVYNSAGQRIWSKEYSNNTLNVLPVDLTGKPAGTYIVRIGYGGKEVETKIIKTN